MRITESIAEYVLPGYPGLTIETLREARGRTIKADWGIVTLLFRARLGESPPRAA